jgi:hypothetical protein
VLIGLAPEPLIRFAQQAAATLAQVPQ